MGRFVSMLVVCTAFGVAMASNSSGNNTMNSMATTTTMKAKAPVVSGTKTFGPFWMLVLCAMFAITMASNSSGNSTMSSMATTTTMKAKAPVVSATNMFGPGAALINAMAFMSFLMVMAYRSL